MTATVIGTFKKVDWVKTLSALVIVAAIVSILNLVVLLEVEENALSWFGMIAFIGGWIMYFRSRGPIDSLERYFCIGAYCVLFAFFFISPLLHVPTVDKVWIIDGKTTLNNEVLLRPPFAPFATSIQKKQPFIGFMKSSTKDGVPIAGTVTGEFRLADDNESVVLSRFGSVKDPDKEVDVLLMQTLHGFFEKAMARMNAAEVAALPSHFTLEVDIGDAAAAVNLLGLKRNGSIIVSNIHPYFVDK